MHFYGFKGLYAHLASWWDIGPLSCHMKKAISKLFQKLFPESSCGFGNKVVTLRCRF